MTKRDSTRILWRVQVRKSRLHKWVNKGTFETRESARAEAWRRRVWGDSLGWSNGYGYGNTRVLRVER